MTEYVITKRERCPNCEGCGLEMSVLSKEALASIGAGRSLIPIDGVENLQDVVCKFCNGVRFTETQVSLLDVLERVRFNIGTDDGRDCMIDPRMDEG